MVLVAFSVQDQVEKYGAYLSIACFLGLAVLSLLYFAQARELKRLREWAGRAPERARELEQRVVAQASATVAEEPPVTPGAGATSPIAPPRRLAEMPPPAAAQAAAGAQATELADAVEADPATNGAVPGAPVNGAAPPEGEADAGVERPEGERAASGNGVAVASQERDADSSEAPDAVPAIPAESADATPAAPAEVAAERDAAPAAPAEVAAERDAAPGAPAEVAAERDATPAAPPADRDATPAVASAPPRDPPPATAVPRATPAQRVGVTPRPAPMPLHQSKPSAGAGRGGPRRTAAPRTAAKPPREGRSAGTIALLAGLTVLILGGGAFAVSQLAGGDDAPAPPNRAAPPPTATQEPETSGSGTAQAPAPAPGDTNVAVLNGTTFPGLAGNLADTIAVKGYQRGVTETNTRDQTIQASVVYYGDGARASARAVGQVLSIDRFEPIDAETQALAPDADVVVLVGADQAP